MKRSWYVAAVAGGVFMAHGASAATRFSLTEEFASGVASTVLYAVIGIILFLLGYKIIDLITPGSLKKQLAEEKNLALAILAGSVMIGIAIIIAASIVG